MINKVILVGNVGKDPEHRATDNSQLVKFPLATSEKYKGETKTEWHNIVIWGKLAEVVQQYVNKGQLLYLEGKLQTRSWNDADGNTKYTTEVVCYSMQMLGSKPKEPDSQQDESNLDNFEAPY